MFDPSIDRWWCELFKIMKEYGPKNPPLYSPRIYKKKCFLGVFRPFIQKSLIKSTKFHKIQHSLQYIKRIGMLIEHVSHHQGVAKLQGCFWPLKFEFWFLWPKLKGCVVCLFISIIIQGRRASVVALFSALMFLTQHEFWQPVVNPLISADKSPISFS